MQESFLHFVWKHQRFDLKNLFTTEFQPIELQSVGTHNYDEGPDFLQAKLSIEEVKWFGSVEIHVNASDWKRHGHDGDPKYNTVVLHVVWNSDAECWREDGEKLPALELKGRVSPDLIKRCDELVNRPAEIPCQSQFRQVRQLDKLSMLDLAAVTRLRRKSESVLKLLETNKGDWEETAYQLLAQNFGFKKNGEPMLKLAQSLAHKWLVKHQSSLEELEALLFGVAGFLEGQEQDDYQRKLQVHYDYLSKKYRLQDRQMLRVEWNFLRMRPANFPTVRLAQLALFFHLNNKFFQDLIHSSPDELKKMFELKHKGYWETHYDFGKRASRPMKALGKQSMEVLVINTAVVLLAAYAQQTSNLEYMDKAVELLQALSPERNSIISGWTELGLKPQSAFDTQALLELKNEFCLKKRCLSCKIGLKLIS